MIVAGLLLAVWVAATWGLAYVAGMAGIAAAQFGAVTGIALTLAAVRGARWWRTRRLARAAAAEASAIAERAATGRPR